MAQETRKPSEKEKIEKAWEEIKKYRGILKGKPIKDLPKEESDKLVNNFLRKKGLKPL